MLPWTTKPPLLWPWGALLSLGHTRIALIDRAEDRFTRGNRGGRRAGYRKALRGAGLPLQSEYEMVAEFGPEAGVAALDILLALRESPTAIFVGSDSQAMGVLNEARRPECRVPDDLSVVGYNDIEISRYLGLTPVRAPMREIGRRGVEMMLARLGEPGQAPRQGPMQECLQASLVVRTTTGPPAAER